MGRPPIDYIMGKPVYSVNENDPVQKAYDTMKANDTKKILVKNTAGKPIGVLEGWKITPKDYDKKVKDISLGKIQLLPKSTNIESVRKALALVSAVYITDPDANDAIIGVVTSYDLFKESTY